MSQKSLDTIAQLRNDLEDIWARAQQDGDTTAAFRRAERWHERGVRLLREHVSHDEAERLKETEQGSFQLGNPMGNLKDLLKLYDATLVSLAEEIERDPTILTDVRRLSAVTDLPDGARQTVPHRTVAAASIVPAPDPRQVFIVHGHDEPNTFRLRDLLRERFGLQPIIMSAAAGRGNTLIEKFEQLADHCSFAFVLLTPDDQIATGSGEYTQARPNVIFELGWFYGRLGRKNVVMLLKEGTRIHSDLDGVSRIQFTKSIEEKVLEIERELEYLLRRDSIS